MKCDSFAEVRGDGIYQPISCALDAGHDGPHVRPVYIDSADDSTEYAALLRWGVATE